MEKGLNYVGKANAEGQVLGVVRGKLYAWTGEWKGTRRVWYPWPIEEKDIEALKAQAILTSQNGKVYGTYDTFLTEWNHTYQEWLEQEAKLAKSRQASREKRLAQEREQQQRDEERRAQVREAAGEFEISLLNPALGLYRSLVNTPRYGQVDLLFYVAKRADYGDGETVHWTAKFTAFYSTEHGVEGGASYSSIEVECKPGDEQKVTREAVVEFIRYFFC